MSTLRRSGRETKQVELFGTFSQDNRKTNGTETDEEDVSVEEPAPKPIKSALKKGKSNFAVAPTPGGSLFDVLTAKKSSNFDVEVNRWIESYKRNKIPAMVEIVNFILKAAGATKDWIAHDVDLDPLGPSELDEMLHEMIEIMSESDGSDLYPLKLKSKSGTFYFREKFQAFFEQLAEKIYSIPPDATTAKKSLNPVEMLHVLIDQLVSLSSMVVANIRDAVTEAACSLGKSILHICVDLKERIAVADRQIKAEESGSSSSSSSSKAGLKSNPKYASLVKSRSDAIKEMDSYSMLANVIFNSLIVHRLKDSNDGVRAVTLQHLFDFLVFDPAKPIKVEYLKYVGFSTFDYAVSVRTTAIKLIIKILEDKRFAGSLNEFVEHFLGHFITQAAGDVDHNVALLTIQALRLMQENALLDEVSEDVLDSVDVIVFDDHATPRVRQEAVAFLMDHTEGFDENPAEAATSSKGKGKSKKGGAGSGGGDDAGALARRQKNAMQLETLTEFAEHHIQGSSYEVTKYLAEACLMLPNYDVLYDWTTIVALLLRESEELISTALRPAQSSALLQMFVTSALAVCETHDSGEDDSLDAEYDALIVCLQKSLASLILRFRDDEAALLVLTDLLEHCDFSSHSNAAVVKNFRGLLKAVTDLFFSVTNERILEKLTVALRTWRSSSDAAIQNAVTSSLKDVLDSVWNSVTEAVRRVKEGLKTRESGNNNSSSSVGGKRRNSGKKSLTPEDGLDEGLLSLANNVKKYKGLWMQLDCGSLTTSLNIDDIVESLVGVTQLCTEVSSSLSSESSRLGGLTVAAGKGAAWTLHNIVLWVFKDIVSLGKEAAAASASGGGNNPITTGKRGRTSESEGEHSKKGGASKAKRSKSGGGRLSASSQSEHEEEEQQESIQERIHSAVDRLLTCRGALVEALTSWLKLVRPQPRNEVDRRLSVIAFHVISELRTYFPVRDSQYKSVDRLAFSPSHEVLNLLRGVFESEGAAVKAQIAACEEDDAGDASKIANQLVLALLLPLSRNLLFDVQNLNRRQAAAVLNYLLDPSEAVQEAVRTVTRKLKESDIVKYLEIQMVLLKSVFGEHVVKAVKTRIAAEENEDDNNFDLIQHAQLEAEGYTVVEDLTRKLSQTLGVAKLRDEALTALENFFRVGLDYALSDMTQVGFTGVLLSYVRFLPPASVKGVAEIVREHMETNQPLIDLIAESESSAFENLAVEKFTAFAHQIDGTGGSAGSKARGGKKRGGVETSARVSPPTKMPATKSRTAAVAAPAAAKKAATSAAVSKKNAAAAAAPTRSSGRAKAVSYHEESDDEEEEEEQEEEEESEGDVEVTQQSQRGKRGTAAAAFSQESRRSTASAASSSSSSSGGAKKNGRGKVSRDFAMGLDIDDEAELEESLAELDAIPSKRRSR